MINSKLTEHLLYLRSSGVRAPVKDLQVLMKAGTAMVRFHPQVHHLPYKIK